MMDEWPSLAAACSGNLVEERKDDGMDQGLDGEDEEMKEWDMVDDAEECAREEEAAAAAAAAAGNEESVRQRGVLLSLICEAERAKWLDAADASRLTGLVNSGDAQKVRYPHPFLPPSFCSSFVFVLLQDLVSLFPHFGCFEHSATPNGNQLLIADLTQPLAFKNRTVLNISRLARLVFIC